MRLSPRFFPPLDAWVTGGDTAGVWLEKPLAFVDAHVVFTTLAGVINAPALVEAAAARFPDGAPDEFIDVGVFAALITGEFLTNTQALQGLVERYRMLNSVDKDDHRQMMVASRRAKVLTEHLKKVDSEVMALKLVGAKRRLWEKETQRDRTKTELDEQTIRAQRHEGQVTQSRKILHTIIATIRNDNALRTQGRWYCEHIAVPTYYGHLLYQVLADMPTEHFLGRTVADVLEKGHSLGQ